jgi:hypothetical protein
MKHLTEIDGPDNGNNGQNQNQAQGGDGANGNNNGNNGGDGGSGGADNGGVNTVTEQDRQLLESIKGVFGDKDPVARLKQFAPLMADVENLNPHLEKARFLAQNPGHDELISYLQRGGTDVQLFESLRKLDTGVLSDIDSIVYKRMYELGIDETTARAAVAFEFKQGDEFANISDGEKAAMSIKLKQDGQLSKQFLTDFKAKATNPEKPASQPGLTPEKLVAIEKAWTPVIEKAKAFNFNFAKEVEGHDKTKIGLAYTIQNDQQIAADVEATLKSFAQSGYEPSEQLVEMAKKIALGNAFERVFSTGIEAVSRQFLSHIAEKFYGVKPQIDGGAAAGNGGNSGTGKLKLVEDTSKAQEQHQDF